MYAAIQFLSLIMLHLLAIIAKSLKPLSHSNYSKTGHEKSSFFGIILWSKICNLAPENAGNGMFEVLKLQIISHGGDPKPPPPPLPTSQQSELTCERFDASEVINA